MQTLPRKILAAALALSISTASRAAPDDKGKTAPPAALPAVSESENGSKPAPAAAGPLTAAQHALEVAGKIPMAKHALHDIRVAASNLKDPALRAAVEAQLQAPWLPPEAYALAHPVEAEEKLHAAGLLAADAHLVIPAMGSGAFASAPGGPCMTGHHGYPGGLSVHEWANVSHAHALSAVYKNIYGVELNEDWLTAAALWHDSLKSVTLPWDANGDCPHAEPQLGGTALHHPLGLAAAMLRHLPAQLILIIAAAHTPPTRDHLTDFCNYLRAAGIVATGNEKAVACPSLEASAPRVPIEAYVNNSADIDFPLTLSVWTWYAAATPNGWERYAALAQDGSDLAAWERAIAHEPESR